MEYRDLYKDVNQLSFSLDRTQFSEVLVVHRMHVRLVDLDVEGAGSEKVRRLYVVADVVEMPPMFNLFIRISSIESVVILCRVLYGPTPGAFSSLMLHNMSVRLVKYESFGKLFPVAKDGGDGVIGVYFHADRIIWRQAQTPTQLNLIRCLIWGPESTYADTTLPQPVKVTDIRSDRMTILDRPIPASESDLQRSDEFEVRMTDEDTLQLSITNISHSLTIGNRTPAFNFLPVPPSSPVAAEVLTDRYVILGFQMNILTAELAQAAAHNVPLIIKALNKHVEWLNKILVEALQVSSSDDDLLSLLFRTEHYLKMATQPRFVVPRLQYHMYRNLIHQMVQVAQAYDDEFQRLQLFIAQNEILGTYLLEQNRALASKEREMSSYHDQVISLRRTELDNSFQRMEQLSVQMENENKAMEQAKEDMDKDLEAHQRRELGRALFAVLGAIGSIALAFVTGGATAPAAVAAAGQAVTAAGALAQGLRRVVEILEGLQALMEIVVIIKELAESLQSIGQVIEAPTMPELPSNADWLIFVNEIEAVAELMPAEVVGSVTVWKAKCRNVAVLGQEMCTTAAHISELQQQIILEGLLKEIADRQADRLLGISAANLSSYTQMLIEIDMRTTRLLLQLIMLLHIQNAAINYEYLFPSSGLLNSWPVRMRTVWQMLVQQELSAVLGLATLGPSTDFVRTYVVKDIPVGLLLDGFDWQFAIPVLEESPTFPIGFSRVRIRHVELKFDGDETGSVIVHQPRTDNGHIYILLQSGTSFSDRRQREAMHYEASTGLAYPYAYNLTTGVPTLTNIPSAEYSNTFMRMTPFTSWRLRLSSSAEENRGLTFPTATSPDDTTQISIIFHITAIREIELKDTGDQEQ